MTTITWKIDTFRETNQEKKQRADTKIEAKNNSDNFERSIREKTNIVIAILQKK